MLGSARNVMMTAQRPPQPIAAYSFNEGSGTTTADSSGNGHTATLGDVGMWSSSGHTSNCVSNISLSTSVSVPAAGWLPTTAITLMAWIYRIDWSQTGRRAMGIWAPGHTDDGFGIGASRGGSAGPFVIITTTNVNSQILQPNQNVLSSGWHHIAATYSMATARLAFYVDGVQTGSTTANGTLSLDPTDNWLFGAGGSGSVLDGRLDDARLYNVALTGTEIATLMNVPVN